MKKKLPILLGGAALLAFFILLPDTARSAVESGLSVCGKVLIPSLFPYFAVSELLIVSGAAQAAAKRLGRRISGIFHLPPVVSVAWTLGLLGGYPVGAKMIGELCREGQLTKRDAEAALPLCSNAGPALFFGMIGGTLLGNSAAGAVLFAIHVASSVIVGLIIRPKRASAEEKRMPCLPERSFSEALTDSVKNAANAMFNVCAFVVFFSVIAAAAGEVLKGVPTAALLIRCTAELTGGAVALAGSALPWAVKFPLLAALAAWGGLSVHLQSMALLRGCDLKMKKYFTGKALHAAVSAALALPVAPLLQSVQSAAAIPSRFAPLSPLPWLGLSVGIVFLIFLQIPTGNSGRNVV
ncbi:MAG: hypothetical protein IJT18_06865 [Oscillospiraceae bacterium]|nr:hypothetical protein [Oscillospiraceae bacterium]